MDDEVEDFFSRKTEVNNLIEYEELLASLNDAKR